MDSITSAATVVDMVENSSLDSKLENEIEVVSLSSMKPEGVGDGEMASDSSTDATVSDNEATNDETT